VISKETREAYKVTIGVETHVQLKTKTKLFSGAGNDAREAPPNTLASHIDFGLPGALPVLNDEAVHLAAKMAFALGVEPQKYSIFERKHYFYPDLPMGYQISQLAQPIIIGGNVVIEIDGEPRTIRINRVQMEADAGKSTHPAGKDYSLVDLNRAGTPLLEIVSESDIKSAAEAKAYARELYLLVRYADVSDANLYYGNMRFDVNVSVSKTDELGTRTETKNLNSFRAVEKTVEYEVNRQIEQLEKGEKIVQETRGWDDAKQKTFSQRTKENADDYRYMPDPDLPPIVLDDTYIEKVKAEMPLLPNDYRRIFADLGIDKKAVEDIIAAPEITQIVKKVLDSSNDFKVARRVAFWLLETGSEDYKTQHIEHLIKLSKMAGENKLSSSAAKIIFDEMLPTGRDPEEIALEKNLLQVSDEGEIVKIVEQVLSDNAKAAEDVKNGEMKAIGFLVGQVMKQSQGKANPQMAQDLIKKQLGI
jgi:aspartyl-tRNA(Asn)/glutamyl-tRNA(Gln) amidotransferase subunit B